MELRRGQMQAGPRRVQKRGRRLLLPEPLRKGKGFRRAEEQAPEKEVCPRRCLEKQGGSLPRRKPSTTTGNTGRCAELRLGGPGWQEKLATAMYPWNPNWHRHQGQRNQWCAPKGPRGAAAPSPCQVSQAPLLSSARLDEHAEGWDRTSTSILHGGSQT